MLQRIKMLVATVITIVALPKTSAVAPPYDVSGFQAITDTLDVIPPDSNGAASKEYLVAALNNQVRVQRKNGEQIQTVSLSGFWSPLDNPLPFDPRTLFDAREERWVMTAVSDRGTLRSSLLVAVSASEDPGGPWDFYRILGNTGAGAFMDFPTMG